MILLTVPHSGRGGDAAALRCSRLIADGLMRGAGVSAVTVQAGLPRSLVDMNRPYAQNTAWRRSVAHMAGSGAFAAHLDVHSFPPGIPELRGADVAVVTPRESADGLSNSMLGCLRAITPRVVLLVRPEITNIRDSVHAALPSVMLEFAEENSPALTSQLCRVVADCVASTADETVGEPPRSHASVTVSRVLLPKEPPATALCGVCQMVLRDPSRFPCRRCLGAAFCCPACRSRHRCRFL